MAYRKPTRASQLKRGIIVWAGNARDEHRELFRSEAVEASTFGGVGAVGYFDEAVGEEDSVDFAPVGQVGGAFDDSGLAGGGGDLDANSGGGVRFGNGEADGCGAGAGNCVWAAADFANFAVE